MNIDQCYRRHRNPPFGHRAIAALNKQPVYLIKVHQSLPEWVQVAKSYSIR